MHTTRTYLLLSLLLCAFQADALALPLLKSKQHRLSVDIQLTSLFDYHTRNPEEHRSAHSLNYADLQNRLNVDIIYNQFRIGGRLDTFHFFADRAPCPDTFPECKGRFVPEKLYLRVRHGHFDFVAGDTYLTIGSGIALSLRKVDEFGVDTSLRGARVSYNNKGFKATVAGGFTNINNMDPVRESFMEDPLQLILAAEASQRIANFFRLGAHYVFADLRSQPGDSARSLDVYTHIVGGVLQIPDLFKRLSFLFEGDFLLHAVGKSQQTGYALYTSLNAYLFPFTIRVEGQWYERLKLPAEVPTRYPTIPAAPILYNNPPTMERQDLDTVGNTENSKGFRIRIDYTLPSRTTVFHLNYLFRFGFVDPGIEDGLHIHNVFIGGEHRLSWMNLNYSVGYRDMEGLENWKLFHLDVDLNVPFLKQHSAEFVARYWWNLKIEEHAQEPNNYYHILDLQLGYAFAKWLSVSVLFSYSDEFDRPVYRHVYIAGQVKVKLWNVATFKVLAGFTRGGLRCISGVCRIFPPFEGIQGELTFRL